MGCFPVGYLIYGKSYLNYRFNFEIRIFKLFDTQNAADSHILCDFNGIRTPGSNHLATWSDGFPVGYLIYGKSYLNYRFNFEIRIFV